MRDKNWLIKVLDEATQRVAAWPDWKKSSELQETQQHQSDDQKEPEAPQQVRCA